MSPEAITDELQYAVGLFCDETWPGEDVLSVGLGLAEEVGEVCRAIVKRRHRTRGTVEEWTAEIEREAADVAIVLLDLAHREGFSLVDAVAEKWEILQARDPNHHPLAASEVGGSE